MSNTSPDYNCFLLADLLLRHAGIVAIAARIEREAGSSASADAIMSVMGNTFDSYVASGHEHGAERRIKSVNHYTGVELATAITGIISDAKLVPIRGASIHEADTLDHELRVLLRRMERDEEKRQAHAQRIKELLEQLADTQTGEVIHR